MNMMRNNNSDQQRFSWCHLSLPLPLQLSLPSEITASFRAILVPCARSAPNSVPFIIEKVFPDPLRKTHPKRRILPMLLATPLHPHSFSTQHTSEDSSKYRPTQDFKSLLPPIEFVEGSSSGGLAVPEGRYEPINGTPKASKVNVRAILAHDRSISS